MGTVVRPRGFPSDALPLWLRTFVEQLSDEAQVPIEMPVAFVLGVLGTVCGGRVEARPRANWVEVPNLYVAVAARPGSRKSTVHKRCTEPLWQAERELAEDFEATLHKLLSDRQIATDRLKDLEKRAATGPVADRDSAAAEAAECRQELARLPEAHDPRLVVSDFTNEELVKIMARNEGRIGVVSAEGDLFPKLFGLYRGNQPDYDVILKAHAGDPIRVDRVKRSTLYIERSSLSICIAMQDAYLEELAAQRMAGERGLFARFLWVVTRDNIGFHCTKPDEMSTQVSEAYTAKVLALQRTLRQLDTTFVVRFSDDAQAAFDSWFEELEPKRRPGGELSDLRGWGAKLEGHVVRMCTLLHLAEHGTDRDGIVDKETFERAVRLGESFTTHARVAFQLMGEDENQRDARIAWEWIANCGKETFSGRDLSRGVRGLKRQRRDAALELLESSGRIRPLWQSHSAHQTRGEFEVRPELVRINGTDRTNGLAKDECVPSVPSVHTTRGDQIEEPDA